MALEPIIEAAEHEKLEPALKAHYKPQGAGFILDVTSKKVGDAVYALEDVGGLRGSLQKERTKAEAAAARLASYADVDPEQAKRDRATVLEWDKSNPNERLQAQYDSKFASAKAEIDSKLKASDALSSKYRSDLLAEKKQNLATRAIAAHKASTKALLPHVLPFIREFEDPSTHEITLRVVDAQGQPRITQLAGQTGDMTVEELVASFKTDDELAFAFPGHQASGGGSNQGGAGGGRSGSGTVKITREQAKSSTQFAALKAQAKASGRPWEIVP